MAAASDTNLLRNPADFGQQIRAARKAQGLTQAELAETAGPGRALSLNWNAAGARHNWDLPSSRHDSWAWEPR